jgi:hypothetical protein
MKRTRTKFNQAQRIVHLTQKGIEKLSTGCLVNIQNIQIIAQRVVYQNTIPHLMKRSVSPNILGRIKKPMKPITKPILFATVNLFANADLNIHIRIMVTK